MIRRILSALFAPAPRRPALSHREDAELMANAAGALARRPNPIAAPLLLAVAGAVAVAGVAGQFIVLDEVTRGEGKVVPFGQNQILTHAEGGIVERIAVREGDTVQKDQILVVLNNPEGTADMREARSRLLAARARLARLEAEVAGQPESAIAFPPEVLRDAPAAAELERRGFRARAETLAAETAVVEEQLRQREQQLREQRSIVEGVRSKLGSLRAELGNAYRAGASNIARIEIIRLTREVRDAEGELRVEELKIPQIESAIREAREKVRDRRNAFLNDARKELNETQSLVAVLTERDKELVFRSRQTEVRAPVRGIVKTLRVSTVGGVVKAGDGVVEIVPLDDQLIVEAQIKPSDIAFMKPGQTALVKFTAYNFATYGGLEGKVAYIGADTEENRAKPGEYFYTVRIRTERNHLVRDGKALPIIPGMTAQVSVRTGEKTLLAYIFKPLTKSIQKTAPAPPEAGPPRGQSAGGG
jgi:membrane fusion protein, adhesin transport system